MQKLMRQTNIGVLTWALISITLGVLPFYSFDPINILRFILILIFGLICLGLIWINRRKLFSLNYRAILIISIAFIIWIVLTTVISKNNFIESLFGITGRQTGFLTYISLVFILLVAVLKTQKFLMNSIMYFLILTGVISALYGLIQFFSLDPFDWINPYSPVFGFFGNPNFQSSFMGISATAALAFILNKNKWHLERVISFIYIGLAMCVIYLSKSQQGYLVFSIGASVVIYLWIKTHHRFSKFTSLYILVWFTGVFITLIDVLQKSPWQPVLYKPSVTFRGDFWRAGWNITKDNPIFGVGLDGYRDSYRLYRDQIAAERNPSAMVDSAHNVFLDISSGGGFPLLIIYCALILLVILSILKVIKREKEFNYSFAAVSGAWVAYQAQSVISINQIGLAIWGWVLSGAIIGYEINTRKDGSSTTVSKPAAERMAVSFGLLIGIVISLPLLLADGQFRSTIKAGDVIKIEQNLDQWPQSVIRMNLAAQIFIDGGFSDRALIISQKAVELNPRNFEAWEKIYLNPQSDENAKSQALVKMRELDPLNPNLK
jgi:O-antigen ligase